MYNSLGPRLLPLGDCASNCRETKNYRAKEEGMVKFYAPSTVSEKDIASTPDGNGARLKNAVFKEHTAIIFASRIRK